MKNEKVASELSNNNASASAAENCSLMSNILPKLKANAVGVQGLRPTMEDEHTIKQNILLHLGAQYPEQQVSYFAVYDGHGGSGCSAFMKKNLFHSVLRQLEARPDGLNASTTETVEKHIKDAMRVAFIETDDSFLVKEAKESRGSNKFEKNSGTTAITLLVHRGMLYCANVGDSRCVLSRAKGAVELSSDQKAFRPDEEARIKRAGGFVMNNRVMGKLAVARAFGDAEFKDRASPLLREHNCRAAVVVADPEFRVQPLVSDDEFAILACDGLWDVCTSAEAVRFVHEQLGRGKSVFEASKNLTSLALGKGSTDNVSVLIVLFKDIPKTSIRN